jgi:hypothetical protein
MLQSGNPPLNASLTCICRWAVSIRSVLRTFHGVSGSKFLYCLHSKDSVNRDSSVSIVTRLLAGRWEFDSR